MMTTLKLLWLGFNIVWSVLYERFFTLQTIETHLYRRPTFRPPASWPQPETSVGRRCHRAEVTVHALAVATLWVAGSFCGVKLWKSPNYLRYFGSFNLFAVNKDMLYFVWINCVVVYLLFSWYISCPSFYNGCACDRFSAWPCSLKRAVYSTKGSQCLECYIYRLSSLDTMQTIGVWEWVVI